MNLFADPPPPAPALPSYQESVQRILAHLKSTGTKGATRQEAAKATGIPSDITYMILDHLKVDGLAILGCPIVYDERGLQSGVETYYFNHSRET